MDWSPHDLRQCLLDPTYRPKPRKKGNGGPLDPTGTLQAAVIVFHKREGGGGQAAMDRLETTLRGDAYRKPQHAPKAQRARHLLAAYCRLAANDGRTPVAGQPRTKVRVDGELLPAGYDLVLHDARGYVARTCIWSSTPRPFEERELQIMANLVVAAVRRDFGPDPEQPTLPFKLDIEPPDVVGVEIFELAHERVTFISTDDAVA